MLAKIKMILAEGIKTFKRFPLEIILAFAGTISAIYLVELDYDDDDAYAIQNLLHTIIVGFTLLLSTSIFAERQKLEVKYKLLLKLATITLLLAYYFHLPLNDLPMVYNIRASLLFSAFHLAVAFIPFVRKGELFGFWEYNKQLFINLLTTILYSVVLYLGLALALAAIENLFKIDVDSDTYVDLWLVMVGIFNTWFFLSKYPKNYEELEGKLRYPKALKLFTQYVLLPLVSVYLIILYLYEFKIIIEWSLPYGWVSYLVLAFSVAGILALLLVYPLQNSKEHQWVRIFTRWFYWALFPLIALFFVAIGKRIIDYGITENRYFVIVLALWLLGISIYLLINKLRNIKMIPMSLAILTLLAIVGPWSAFNVSENSQHKRLINILEKNNILENGKVKEASDSISFETEKEISSIVYYMVRTHGYSSLEDLFAKPMDEIIDSTVSKYSQSSVLLKEMNLKYVSSWEQTADRSFWYNNSDANAIDVTEYNYFLSFDQIKASSKDEIYEDSIKLDRLNSNLKFYLNENVFTVEIDTLKMLFDYSELVSELHSNYESHEHEIPSEAFELINENENYKIKLIATRLAGEDENNVLLLNRIEGNILIKFKK